MNGEDESPLIPVRRLHNFVYCPRLMYFQFVENIFVYNSDVVEGEVVHGRVDNPSMGLFPEDLLTSEHEIIRSLALESSELGICGIIDLLKKQPDHSWQIYDYKRGSPLKDIHGNSIPKEADTLQIQAYACLAENNGMKISAGFVYYAETKTLLEVPLADSMEKVSKIINQVRSVIKNGMPLPLESDNRCLSCSLYSVCMPDETLFWRRQHKNSTPVRPPLPDDDPGEILIVQNSKAYLSKHGETLSVTVNGTQVSSHPLHNLRSIYLYGAAQLSTQLVHACLTSGINVAFFSPAGKFIGKLEPLTISGMDSRQGQYRLNAQESSALKLAQAMIRAKISNQRTLLLRNMKEKDDRIIKDLAALKNNVALCKNRTELMGIEGKAAALYFSSFSKMLLPSFFADNFHERNRRPPRDPVNAMLSLGYSILSAEIAGICSTVGLDPACGILHAPHFGRPALALDIMEEFRPLIVDSTVLSLINKEYISKDDFIFSSQGCALKKSGHKAYWNAYSNRMTEELTHPAFHYKMSYRRLLEVQVRQLWRIFRGDQTAYHPIITR